MSVYTPPVNRLIEELRKIPGVGRKSAQRMAFFLLKEEKSKVFELADSIVQARENIRLCSACNNYSESELCEICMDSERDRTKICVVEEPFNIYSVENTNLYKGLYHVLHGNLSPISGVGPDELKIDSLVKRVDLGEARELIIATSPTTEGNATAHYLTDLLKDKNISITRIALGLPVGADIDYVDSVTIARAFEGRREM